jgi:hypothetical protein
MAYEDRIGGEAVELRGGVVLDRRDARVETARHGDLRDGAGIVHVPPAVCGDPGPVRDDGARCRFPPATGSSALWQAAAGARSASERRSPASAMHSLAIVEHTPEADGLGRLGRDRESRGNDGAGGERGRGPRGDPCGHAPKVELERSAP